MSVVKSAMILPLCLVLVAIGALAKLGAIPYSVVPVLGFTVGVVIKRVWISV